MENAEHERTLEDFRDYLTIDRQLAEGTVDRHILELKRLFKASGF